MDATLPPPADTSRLDEWWAKVFACGRYVALPKVVATALSRRDLEEASNAKMAKRAKLNMPSTSSALSKAKAALHTKKQEKETREAHKKKRLERAAKLSKLPAKKKVK